MVMISKSITLITWCMLSFLFNEAFVNGLNNDGDHEADTNDHAKTTKSKRPVLKYGSFGYSHAHHLSGDYLGSYGLNVNKEYFGETADDRGGHHFHQRSSRPKPQKAVVKSKAKGFDNSCEGIDIVCDEKSKLYRTADGRCNNIKMPSWGKSETAYRRILPRKQSLGECSNGEIGPHHLPNARHASMSLTERLTAEDGRDLHEDLSVYTVFWGQVIDHDLLLTPLRKTIDDEFLDCCDSANSDAKECCSIMPQKDFFYGRNKIPKCIPFIRSKLTDPIPDGCGETDLLNRKSMPMPDVENGNTHFLDASFVYGSTEERAISLRTLDGGKLKVTADRTGRPWPPLTSDNEAVRMEFGDTRGDVHPGFTLLNTVYVRCHNLIVERLAKIRPDWDDEKLYQETRKIVVAIHQHITYTQWIDALIGTHNSLRTDDRKVHEDFYMPGVDPTVSMVFSTSAFRLHTLVPGSLQKRNAKYEFTENVLLREVFHQPLKLLENSTYDDLMRGMAWQPAWAFNNLYSEDLTEMLFAEENNGTFGMDIISLNIQRGRDHQIQGYVAYREACGFGSVKSWSDLSKFIPSPLVDRLQRIYSRPEDVDMYIGGNMEKRVEGSLLGPTMHCLIQEQFERLRDGDRHFYTRPSEFSKEQLNSIKKAGTLSHLFCTACDKPEDMWMPKNMFQLNLEKNQLQPCSKFSSIDLTPWEKVH